MKEAITREIVLGDGVSASVQDGVLTVKGPKGEVAKPFVHPKVELRVEEVKIVLHVDKGTKREKTIIGSFASHITNMVQGVQEPFEYKVKICSGHFPMNVSLSGQELTIKNFLGESVPRKVTLPQGADVKIDGTDITITSPSKEIAGLTAAKIESLCRITDRDRRIFQDGCYITHKAGKEV